MRSPLAFAPFESRNGHYITKILCLLLTVASTSQGRFQSAYEDCPTACDPATLDPAAWTYYYRLNELDSCDRTVIFQMNLYNAIDDPATHVYYRACSTSEEAPGRRIRRQNLSLNDTIETPALVELVQSGSPRSPSNIQSAHAVLAALQGYLDRAVNGTSTLFARSGDIVAGMYAGSQIDKESAVSAIGEVREGAAQDHLPTQLVAQACGPTVSNETISPQFFGVIVDSRGDVAAVQSVLRGWNDAECFDGARIDGLQDISVDLIPGSQVSIDPEPGLKKIPNDRPSLAARQSNTCQYTQIQAGDGCFAVSQRCGITISQLESYNGGGNFCTTLQIDQYACCSSGSLPDFTPQPEDDGSCFAYTVKDGDYCYDIATRYQMTVSDLERRNSQTW